MRLSDNSNNSNKHINHSKSDTSTSWKVIVFSAILGSVVGGAATFLGSYILYQQQQDLESHAVAQALAIDIYDTSQTLNCSLAFYESHENFSGSWGVYRELTPFYNDHGLYYAYEPEIYRLRPNISEDIYLYYTQVFDIERERQFIVDHYTNETEFNNSTASMQNAITGMSGAMHMQIPAAITQGNKVENELKGNYSINSNLSMLNRSIAEQNKYK